MKKLIKKILRENIIKEERTRVNVPVPEDVKQIKDVFVKNGYKLYIVGGAVRDALLGKTPKDYDLATNALPDKVESMMQQAGLRTLETGKAFGVINVFVDDEEYEIATFRKDSYDDQDISNAKILDLLSFVNKQNLKSVEFSNWFNNRFLKWEKGEIPEFDNWVDMAKKDIPLIMKKFSVGSGRRPDSVEFTTINQDVKRRDLTINALFYDIDTGEVVDLVGGVDDLKNGIVRTVGSPKERFEEDRLRILRAIRFAGRFGSGLDPAVDAALKKDNSLEGISPERIRDEFLKGIKTAKSLKHFLSLINQYNLWGNIFPGLTINTSDVANDKDPIVTIANLLKNNEPNNLSKVLNTLKYSATENKAITFLVALQQFDTPDKIYIFKKLQNKSGISDEQILKFGMLVKLPIRMIKPFIDFKLSVNGKQAQEELGVKPGPEMGKAIEKMEINKFKDLL